VSATLLGEPDLGLLTPPEMARKAGQIIYGIPNVPVLVDADTGETMMAVVVILVIKPVVAVTTTIMLRAVIMMMITILILMHDGLVR
jgi:2-methylisocitrate lyase-like PEP mutase family enzyme